MRVHCSWVVRASVAQTPSCRRSSNLWDIAAKREPPIGSLCGLFCVLCLCPSFRKQSGIDKKTVAQCNPQCAFFYFLSICSHNFIVYVNASAIFTIKMERDIHRSMDVAANDDCDNCDFDSEIVPTVYLGVWLVLASQSISTRHPSNSCAQFRLQIE